jgi:hypothetical protein
MKIIETMDQTRASGLIHGSDLSICTVLRTSLLLDVLFPFPSYPPAADAIFVGPSYYYLIVLTL